jgi:hypothetical protein
MYYIVTKENRFYQEVLGDVGQWVMSKRDATKYEDKRVAQYVASNRGGVVMEVQAK